MYVYKTKDKEQKNAIHLSEAVRYKTLWNKAERLQLDMEEIRVSLMFQGEDVKTRSHLYLAIDELNKFKHNLKLKKGFED